MAAVQPIYGQDEATATAPSQRVTTLDGALYRPMIFSAEIDPESYINPFSADDIQLLGIFTSPSGRQMVVPGFWMQPYEDACENDCEAENLQPVGEPIWQVRFTPQEVGEWSYRLQVEDRVTVRDLEQGQINVVDSEHPGFIRRAENSGYFQYQNGLPFFPIGHNLNWSWDGGGGLYAYEEWLARLSDAGGNYARLYIDIPWFIGLEWEAPAGDYRAAQAAAARLDAILEMAAEYGIALQLTLVWHQAFNVYTGLPVVAPDTFARPDMNADWDNNPYNLIYGGPVGGPGIFFFNDSAQALFRQRLRYIIARWGYSPQVFAWELIDRIDRTGGYDPAIAGAWLQETASYIKQIDQHGHLISAGSSSFDQTVATSPLLDFTEGQFYQRRPIETVSDQVTGTVDLIRRYRQANTTPTLLVDFSLNPWFEPTAEDPQGVHVQTTLWASVMAGAAGGAMGGWWDTYIVPQDLERYYPPLAAFVAGIDWPRLDMQPAEAGLLTAEGGNFGAVRVSNFNRQFSARAADAAITYAVTADGVFPPIEAVPSYLYGQVFNNQFSQLQLYQVTPSVDTYLEVRVRRVSSQAGARLVVLVDEREVGSLDLSIGSRDVSLRVPLLAGEHQIALDNTGDDWLELEYLEVGNLTAPVRALTLRDATAGVAVAWLQHRDYTWEHVAAGVEPKAITLNYRLNDMPPGRYSVEIWDPLAGAVLGDTLVRVGDDRILAVDLPPLTSQLALRMFRQAEAAMPEATITETPLPEVTATETAIPTATDTLTPTETETPPPTFTETATASPSPIPNIAVQTNTPRPTVLPSG